jgi:hypothetical protein
MGSYIKEAPSVMGSGFFYGSLDFLLFLEVVKAVKGSWYSGETMTFNSLIEKFLFCCDVWNVL